MATCPHCLAGDKRVWQAFSREYVHRNSVTVGSGTTFSITICTNPPPPPDPNQIEAP